MPGKILILDHTKAFASQLRKILMQTGIRVEVRGDPISGNMAIQEFQPDLVILEMNLAAGGAKVVYRNLRMNEKFCNVPVIILVAPDTNPLVWEDLGSPPHPRTFVLRRALNMKLLLPLIQKVLASKDAQPGAV